MKLYVLTDTNLNAGDRQYTFGVKETAPCTGPLNSNGWLHAYTDPLLAILFNPVYVTITNPRLFWFDGDIERTESCNVRVGVREVTLFPENEVHLPPITADTIVGFGILCSKAVYNNPVWEEWADNWLSGKRNIESAISAARLVSDMSKDISDDDTRIAAKAAETATLAAAMAIAAESNDVNIYQIAEMAAWAATWSFMFWTEKLR